MGLFKIKHRIPGTASLLYYIYTKNFENDSLRAFLKDDKVVWIAALAK